MSILLCRFVKPFYPQAMSEQNEIIDKDQRSDQNSIGLYSKLFGITMLFVAIAHSVTQRVL